MEDLNKNTEADKQSARMVRQAMNDDQALSSVAHGIGVTVKDGTITLNGEVDTQQQMNLATNTAAALGADDKVNNRMEITQNQDLSRADDDGFAGEKSKDNSLLTG